MIPGGILPNHEPDGNSVIFSAPAGLMVVDTGRHQWHREAILSFARTHKKNIVTMVNSHWHLDGVDGNPALRAAYPHLEVYASGAIDGALTGFRHRARRKRMPISRDSQIPEDMREDIREDLLTIQNGAALRPDIVITTSA